MDWESRGQAAALQGQTLEGGQSYYERECHARHDVQPDAQAFQTGFARGLKEFCTPAYSYRFAHEGGQYQGTCPKADETGLASSYKDGRVKYLEEQLALLKAEVEGLQSDNDQLQSEKSALESQLGACQSRPLSSQY
jgi:hypothetical protein